MKLNNNYKLNIITKFTCFINNKIKIKYDESFLISPKCWIKNKKSSKVIIFSILNSEKRFFTMTAVGILTTFFLSTQHIIYKHTFWKNKKIPENQSGAKPHLCQNNNTVMVVKLNSKMFRSTYPAVLRHLWILWDRSRHVARVVLRDLYVKPSFKLTFGSRGDGVNKHIDYIQSVPRSFVYARGKSKPFAFIWLNRVGAGGGGDL